ncbi:hypothetical protein AXX12_15955 [Anaerosporomusa subterranea]|uniref:Uncharacterized protein n=1 Tax=Anaerosporomusa subterranea TaxID=1794912 RepID=A0A154BM60_ANASB|nr:hypothetical protein [Anaerosporomusa subterranea]KYZ75067.1 hypothetical protein AXX12_15955 [Anaerosporomusa subterranea]
MDRNIEGIKVSADDSLTPAEVEATVRAEKVFWQAQNKQIESIEVFLADEDILVRVKEKIEH